ncbi:hypothetical protein LTR08_002523 [Meristemomyces frigidus]|nr:hypothetical protein LTR08_002523 [Meristemomyces frigidus]
MDSLLSAVKTVRSQISNDDNEPRHGLTVRSSQRTTRPPQEPPKASEKITKPPTAAKPIRETEQVPSPSTPEDALAILRSQPSTEVLVATLDSLLARDTSTSHPAFNLAAPGPLQAQIINALLTTIVPTFWATADEALKRKLISCVTNVAGNNAVIAKLRSAGGSKATGEEIRHLLALTTLLFQCQDHSFALKLFSQLASAVPEASKSAVARKELVTLLASGKLISAVAQAEETLRRHDSTLRASKPSWLADGKEYAGWLGANIAYLSEADVAAQLLTKALNLGYPTPLVQGLVVPLVRRDVAREREARGEGEGESGGEGECEGGSGSEREGKGEGNSIARLLEQMPAYAKRRFVELVLGWLAGLVGAGRSGGDAEEADEDEEQDPAATNAREKEAVIAIAAFLHWFSHGDLAVTEILTSTLTDPPLNTPPPPPLRLALLTHLASTTPATLQPLLQKTLTTFTTPLSITHLPLPHQNTLAQTLLLAAGHLHRLNPPALAQIARGAVHLQGVSNRLDSSSARARWLGMIVATAISRLVDAEGKRMEFDSEDMRTPEAEWYLGLVLAEGRVGGGLGEFETWLNAVAQLTKPARRSRITKTTAPTLNGKPVFGPPRPPAPGPAQTEVIGARISEVSDRESGSEGEGEEDLKPHAKPDSDAEDSDEDATLVNRDKVRAPVYIRDLMRMLHNDKDPVTFTLGITTAAALIRRKIGFGKEVGDHAEELLTTLCNLQDPFELENFDELRLQALIAVLTSDIARLGPWLSRQIFAGEYSIAGRSLMLTALGLAGREIAGVASTSEGGGGGEDELNPAIRDTDFASKKLPPRLHALYTPPNPARASNKRLDTASKSVEQTILGPLALRAADAQTAHLNAVKIRTFSSRLTTPSNRTHRPPPPNNLSKVFAASIFAPLVGRYRQDLSAYGHASVFSNVPVLIVAFLKTVALLLHASGPATLGLAEVTDETLALLLGLRVRAGGDMSVLEAVLFSLLTLLEVNSAGNNLQILLERNGREIEELGNWTSGVFEKFEGRGIGGRGVDGRDGGEEEGRVRMLAAGVLVRIREILEGGRERMFGRVGR